MKTSKNAYLGLGLLFAIDFLFSLFDKRDTHELFFWDVNIWIYRLYRLLLATFTLALYFRQINLESKDKSLPKS